MEPINATPLSESRPAKFEVRPSAARQWNPDAPDEIVFVDGKKRGFGDLLQAINPLHHLPIVSTIYREITGSKIEPAARVVGGLIFGGPAGIASALVNAFVEDTSGKDIGGHVAALVKPGADPNAPPPPPGSRPAGSDDGQVFLASLATRSLRTSGGFAESDGLLTTWIAAGAPRSEPILEARAAEPARAMPTHLPLYTPPVTHPPAEPAPAPVQAAAQIEPSAPAFLPATGRGRSLAEYRAQAQAMPLGAMRTPVPSDPLANQRGGPRTLASYRAEAQTPLPATIEAQRQADPAQPGAPQDWISAMMTAGLDRYRDAQRRRDAAPPQDRL